MCVQFSAKPHNMVASFGSIEGVNIKFTNHIGVLSTLPATYLVL